MTRVNNVSKEIITGQLYQEVKELLGDNNLRTKVKWNRQEQWVEVDADITEAQLQDLVDRHVPKPGGSFEGDTARLFELLTLYCNGTGLTHQEEEELQRLERKRLWVHLGGVPDGTT